MTMLPVPGELKPGEILNMRAGGDGDQSYLGIDLSVRVVQESWFPNRIPSYGEAVMLRIVGGPHDGEYLAITTKTRARIHDSMTKFGWAVVVVHRIINCTSYSDEERDSVPIGMSSVERAAYGRE